MLITILSHLSAIDGVLGPKHRPDEDLLVNTESEKEGKKEDKLLKRLRVFRQASGKSIPRCMSGTRRDILAQITTWLDSNDPNGRNIFWLSGFPGVGKSAIASTLAADLVTSGRLISNFCFERDDSSRTSPAALW